MRALGVRRLARAVPRDYVEALIGYWLTIGTTRLWTLAAVIAPAPERLFAAPTDLSGRRQSQDALRQVTSRDALRTGYRTTGRDGDWWAAANVSWWPRRAAHLLFATRCPLRRLGPKHACRGQLLLGGRVGLLEIGRSLVHRSLSGCGPVSGRGGGAGARRLSGRHSGLEVFEVRPQVSGDHGALLQ